MGFCVVFEVAGPFRWWKYEKAGRLRRVMLAWFSVSVFPYKWTEFLRLYRLAAEQQREEILQHDFMRDISRTCGTKSD